MFHRGIERSIAPVARIYRICIFSRSTDAVFRSTPTLFTADSTVAFRLTFSFFLIDVMLVLSDSDRLRVNLDQFSERILQPSRDGYGSPDRYVQF